jgi:hypothetical protein
MDGLKGLGSIGRDSLKDLYKMAHDALKDGTNSPVTA